MPNNGNFRITWYVRFFSVLFLVLISGCAYTPLHRDLSVHPEKAIPKRVMIPLVPFYPQKAFQCGPAALAMALAWSGTPIDLEQLVPEVYTPARKGSLQPALIGAARRRNRLAFPIRGAEALFAELAVGHPVIVLQNLGLKWIPRWHYAVIIGFDLEERTFTLHSGETQGQKMRQSLFMRTWDRADRWGLLVLPAGKVPANASEHSYLNAVLGLEQTGQWKGAAKAYRAGIERWGNSLGALMGLGNSLYTLGDLIGAEQIFRRAAKSHPGSGAAFNNLAHVLAGLHRYREALESAHRSVELGGAEASLFQDTLLEIESHYLDHKKLPTLFSPSDRLRPAQ